MTDGDKFAGIIINTMREALETGGGAAAFDSKTIRAAARGKKFRTELLYKQSEHFHVGIAEAGRKIFGRRRLCVGSLAQHFQKTATEFYL
jgi:hypothetical protein